MPQPMIEEISLPIHLRDSSDPFKIADEARDLCIARNSDQHVQVIGH